MLATSLKALPPSAWLQALRPKTLTASLIPVLVGTLLVIPYGQEISWGLALAALGSAFCIQIATNVINDALDFKKGADNKREAARSLRPTQLALQSGRLKASQVLAVGFFFLSLAALFALPLIVVGGLPLLGVMAASLVCAYLYTGGPFPLSYTGIADLFVILFFGVVAAAASFYVQTGFVAWPALVAGLQIGLLATAMIAINNLRDFEGDAKAGRKTIPIRFGIFAGKLEVAFAIFFPFCLGFFWWQNGWPYVALFPFLTLPLACFIVQRIFTHAPSKQYDAFFGMSALLHVQFGLLLALGIVWS